MLHKLFLSVGAMKAGTTWLYDKFKLHPEIHFGFEKELHFHAQKYGVGNPLSLERRRRRAEVVLRKLLKSHEHRREVERCIRWYVHFVGVPVDDDWFEQLMTMDRSGDGYIADFSNLTCHLKSDHWMDLRKSVEQLRVIYILRDPVERVWSHYKYHLKFAKHPSADVPSENINGFKRILDKKWFIRNSFYSNVIRTLNASLDQREFMICYFEDMVSEPLSFLQSIESFLSIRFLDFDSSSLRERKNASTGVSMPEEWRAYAANLLAPEIAWLKESSYWHPKWKSLS